MNFYFAMVNAWSLAASILNGTLDEDYPIMDKTKGRWWEDIRITPKESDEYDPPITTDGNVTIIGYENAILATEGAYDGYYFKHVGTGNTALDKVREDITGDGLDYEIDGWETNDGPLSASSYYDDYMADIDDQRAHHFNYYGTEKMDYEPQRNHQYKYHEEEILKDIEEYVSNTYNGHYTGTKHEFRKVQTIDLMAARDIAAQFCQANILKYGSRYGSKDGRNKKDLLKVIHYAMLLLHFDGHYGKPSVPTDDFNQMP